MPRTDRSIKKCPSHILLWLAVAFLVIGTVLIGSLSASGSLVQSYRLATSHQPERYTQLYFDAPAKLPSYAPTGKLQTIPFTIANHTAQAQTYAYEIIITIGGNTTTTLQNVRLLNGQAVRLSAKFTIPTPLTKAHLHIRLTGTNEQLTLESTS